MLAKVYSTSHQIHIGVCDGRWFKKVQLDNKDTIPNKDLILRYQVAGETDSIYNISSVSERGGHFATYLIPAQRHAKSNELCLKDVVF